MPVELIGLEAHSFASAILGRFDAIFGRFDAGSSMES